MAQQSYISAAEFAEMFDTRVIGQLSSDTGTDAGTSNAIVLACIEKASGELEAAVLKAGRYTEADLLLLQTDDDSQLKQIVGKLTLLQLYNRRQGVIPSTVEDMRRDTLEQLDMLAKGTRILRDEDAVVAGKARIKIISQTVRNTARFVSDVPNLPPRRTRLI